MLKRGTNICWPTMVEYGQVSNSEVLLELGNFILSNCDLSGRPDDNVNDLFSYDDLIIDRFKNELIVPEINKYLKKVYDTNLDNYPDYTVKSWVAGFHNGYGIDNHNHPKAQISAVFYVLAEEIVNSGTITLTDPRGNANRGYDEHFLRYFNNEHLAPKTGDFLIFPSYVFHHVWPYYTSMRISVPVDVYLNNEITLRK